jgi:hypothetical protein
MTELAQIVISYVAIGAYFVRMMLTNEILEVFDKTYGNGYIRLDKVKLERKHYF